MVANSQFVCPWWIGYLLINPFRKFMHNPDRLLKPFIKPGMQIADFGCAMGFFSLPMARLAGTAGKVYAIDIQEKMIQSLRKRITKAGLNQIIQPILIDKKTTFTELRNKIDFVLLFAMVHEVPDKMNLFNHIGAMLKSGGQAFFAEPKGHVSLSGFETSVGFASLAGLVKVKELSVNGCYAVLLEKQ